MEYVSCKESQCANGLILIRSRTATIDSGQQESSYVFRCDRGCWIERRKKTTGVTVVRLPRPRAVTPYPQFFVEAMEYCRAVHASNLETDRGDTMAKPATMRNELCQTERFSSPRVVDRIHGNVVPGFGRGGKRLEATALHLHRLQELVKLWVQRHHSGCECNAHG